MSIKGRPRKIQYPQRASVERLKKAYPEMTYFEVMKELNPDITENDSRNILNTWRKEDDLAKQLEENLIVPNKTPGLIIAEQDKEFYKELSDESKKEVLADAQEVNYIGSAEMQELTKMEIAYNANIALLHRSKTAIKKAKMEEKLVDYFLQQQSEGNFKNAGYMVKLLNEK